MLSTQACQEQTANFQTNSINANIAEGGASSASTSNALGVNNTNCP